QALFKGRLFAALLERVLGWQASGGLRRWRTGRGGLRRRRPIVVASGIFLLLLLNLRLLLLPRLQRLLQLRRVIRVADRGAIAALLLGLRLESFPDDGRLGFLGRRETAEEGLDARSVDAYTA